MKLIYKKYLNFYKNKLFYLKGEDAMIDKILSLKERYGDLWNCGKR